MDWQGQGTVIATGAEQRAAITRRLAGSCAGASLVVCLLAIIGRMAGADPHIAGMSSVNTIGCAIVATGTLPGLASHPRVRLGLSLIAMTIAVTVAHGSPAPATGILLLAIASLRAVQRLRGASDLLAGVTLLLSGIVLLGNLYGARDFYGISLFRTMSLATALALFLTAIATVFGRERGGWASIISAPGAPGATTRRQMACLLVPPLAGWLLVRATGLGPFGVAESMVLLVIITVAPLLWLILRDGVALADLEQERDAHDATEARHMATLEARLTAQAEQIEAQNNETIRLLEAASLRSEDRYRSLFNSIDSGFCVIEMAFDADGNAINYRFHEINAAFGIMTGIPEASGKWMRDLVPGYDQGWYDLLGRVALTGIPARYEKPAEGTTDRWYDVHAFRIDVPGRHHVGVLFTDISARRNYELALQDTNRTLEERVADAVTERELVQEALRQSQKMEAIGQLTGGVAHDFNNLLVPILGNLDLLIRRNIGTERERKLLEGAMQSADRAKTLVQRLLAFARRQPLQVTAVDIAQLVDGMAHIVGSTSGPQIRVVVEIPPGLPPALADANQIEMAILNLCVNARDAMPGGGTVTISACTETVSDPGRNTLSPGDYVRLAVTDTGTGMDADTLAHAIEPFFSTKGIGKGTGLGLSMVHGLASQLGGTLEIISAVDLGTTVALWLPQSATAVVADDGGNDTLLTAGQRGRALVVDDEDLVRMTTSEMLQDIGYDTVEMASAYEAEDFLRKGGQVELVVTDHLMPGITGAQLAATIRANWPDIAVLLISGYAAPEGVPADLPRLTKPFKHDGLSAAIAELH